MSMLKPDDSITRTSVLRAFKTENLVPPTAAYRGLTVLLFVLLYQYFDRILLEY